ncbi:MAG: autotransporter domain-containing protein [Amaricoccus sp.]|uniref:autotransporter outer membrane beta-barrel domain-containing protein n=1 Tax=Amaricoccus sp. TaxID=1872485 RepID=UPI0039E21B7B
MKNSPFLSFELETGETELALAVERSETAFADVADTGNQAATATGLESLGAGNSLYDDVVGMTGAEARAEFDLLSGEIHASMPAALTQDSQYTRDALIARLRLASGAVGATHAPGLADGRMAFAPVPGEQPAAWGQAYGGWGHLDGDGDAATLDQSAGGLLLGADATIALWRVGGMIGFGDGSYDLDNRASSGETKSFHLGAYAGRDWGAVGFRSGVSMSWNQISTDRRSSDEDLSADYDGRTAQIFGELARRIESGATAFEPYVGLAYVHLTTDGFEETGGAAALSGKAASMDTTFTTLGVRGSHDTQLGAARATLSGGIGWRHAFGDVASSATMAFDGGAGFEVAGVPIAEDVGLLDLGLDMALSPTSALAVDYQGEFASGAATNRLAATLTIRF